MIMMIALCMAGGAMGQTQFSGKVYIPDGADIKRLDKVDEPRNLKVGDKVTNEWKYTKNDVEYNVEQEEVVTSARQESFVKTKSVDMKGLKGFANITPDKDKPNVIKVNFWLNPTHIVPKNIRIRELTRTWPTVGSAAMSETIKRDEVLTAQEKFTLWKVPSSELAAVSQENWFKHATSLIEVYDASGTTIDYYLVDKYGQKAEYIISYGNRDYFKFNASNWDVGAITIPFKIRPGYETNGIKVETEIMADYNVGLFGGWSYGCERYRYETGELKKLSNIKVSVGGFVSLGKQDLDSLATTTADVPLVKDITRSMMIVTVGGGVMFSFADIKLGAFVGTDLGTGEYSKKWNFHGRYWVGLGLGYNLAGLFPKKS